MPRRSEPPYFAILCSDAELRRHLDVCRNSDFRVTENGALACVTVMDRETVVLHAAQVIGYWQVRLHRKYYRHPFGPPSDGNALLGVP